MPDSPIGTIMAFAGARSIITDKWENDNGWLLCDGRQLSKTQDHNKYLDLHKAIDRNWGGDGGNLFNLPDLRGVFLRGVDSLDPREQRDPDHDKREPNRPGGNPSGSPELVGSVQKPATAHPTSGPFKTKEQPAHSHGIPFETGATRTVAGDLVHNTVTSQQGVAHPFNVDNAGGQESYIIGGGDRETRPFNAYVYWIIKYKK